MDVQRRWTWAMGLALVACEPIMKSGGEILDGSTAGADELGEGGTAGPLECGDVPVCGDGIIGAPETCDDDVGCDACASTPMLDSLVDRTHAMVTAIADDGTMLVWSNDGGGSGMLDHRRVSGGPKWVSSLDDGDKTRGGGVAVDAAGNSYVVGTTQSPESRPWITVLDIGADVLWSATGADDDDGSFYGVAVSGDRVAAVGAYTGTDSGQDQSLIRLLDTDGVEQWSQGDLSFSRYQTVAFTGDELAVIAVHQAQDDEPGTRSALQRFDLEATRRWSIDLPVGSAGDVQTWQVVADGAGGTWTAGQASSGPYAVRHDGEGDVVEELDCIGGALGEIVMLDVHPDGRLALAITTTESVGDESVSRAWFPVVEGGVVTSALSFPTAGVDVRAFAVGWYGDQRIVGWTDGSLGIDGWNHILLVP